MSSRFQTDSEDRRQSFTRQQRQHSTKREKRASQAFYDSADDVSSSSFLFESSRSLDLSERLSERVGAARLRFDTLGLVGRDNEKRQLLECLDRSTKEADFSSRELVLIHGESGSGKTAVALSLVEEVKRRNGIFATGKFNLDHITSPYTAVSSLCNQICDEIISIELAEKDRFKDIQCLLSDKLGPSKSLLCDIVPQLAIVLNVDKMTRTSPESKIQSIIGNEQMKASLLFAFKTFFRIVSEKLSPLVMFLDDLQWCNGASLEVVEEMLNDVENKELFVVFTYRSEEITEGHSFSRLMSDVLKIKDEALSLNVTELEIQNLTVESLNEILMILLNIDVPEDVLPLAKLCHRRTLGNIMYTLAFLRNLQSEKLIEFNMGLFKWTWQVDDILNRTIATANVVELLKDELMRLSKERRQCLSLAACLGNSFLVDVVQLAVDDIFNVDDGTPRDEEGEPNWLSMAENRGFIERHSGTSRPLYQWVHDSVREACLLLVPPKELSYIKGRLAKFLHLELPREDSDGFLFVIANLLHDGNFDEDEDLDLFRIEMAKVNLLAAQKAMRISAFDSGVKYSGRGIDLLPVDRWEKEYDLTLQLYTVSAKLCSAMGELEALEERFRAVESQRGIPFPDKLGIYSAKIDSLIAENADSKGFDQATDILINLLSNQGIRFPRTKLGRMFMIVSNLLRIRRKCNRLTETDLGELPEMQTDSITQLGLLDQLSRGAYGGSRESDKLLVPLSIFEMFFLTLDQGLSVYSSIVLSLMGFVFAGIGEIKLCGKMGNLSLEMMKTQPQFANARARFMSYTYCRSWVEPLANFPIGLFDAYQLGMAQGDMDAALYCIVNYMMINFQIGRPLEQIQQDCQEYGSVMKERKQFSIIANTEVLWIATTLLIGEKTLTVSFTDLQAGTPLNELAERRTNDLITSSVLKVYQSIVHCYLGDNEAGAQHAIAHGFDYRKDYPGHFSTCHHVFSCARVLYAMAIKTGKRKYKRHAKRFHKTIRSWKEKGNPNVIHYDLLLNAEAAFLQGNFTTAESCFRKAKSVCSRGGFLNDGALARERYAVLLMQSYPSEAAYMIEEAIELYDEWGAHEKVKRIEEEHANLLANVITE